MKTSFLAVPLAVATLSVSVAVVPSDSAGAAQKAEAAGASISSAGTKTGLQATAGAAASIDATSIAKTLLESVAKSAGNKLGGAIAGWALDAIFGTSGGNGDQVQEQLTQLSTQVQNLSTQVDQLHTQLKGQLDDIFKKLQYQAERNTYDGLAAQVNQDSATLSDYQIRFNSWLTKTPGTPVSASQSAVLLQMRDNLGRIINDLNNAMTGGAPGARGLIEVYGSVIRKSLPYVSMDAPTIADLYTSDDTTPVSDQLDYYEGLVVQAFTMLAEVNHLSWTNGGLAYDADTPYVETYANCLPRLLANWNELATGGLGRLPDGVVGDSSTGVMWLRSNLHVTGDGNPTPGLYCWAGCFPDESLATWVTPARVVDGLKGWRVPSQADFSTLVAEVHGGGTDYLRANGFLWKDSTSLKINGITIAVPSYWVNGGTLIDFNSYGASFTPASAWLGALIPGPGAVLVRNVG